MTTTILSLAPRLISRLPRSLAPVIHTRILPASRSFLSSVRLSVGAKKAASIEHAPTRPKSKLKPKLKPKSKLKSIRKPAKAKAKSKSAGRPKSIRSKAAKAAKPKIRLTRAVKPPRAPPNAFILFFQEQIALNRPASIAETAEIARASANRWRSMAPVEQQPFRAAHIAARAQYVEQRAAYWAGVDPSVVRALNAQRRVQGKPRLRAPRGTPTKPLTGFFRFMRVFRESPEGREVTAEGMRDGKRAVVRMCEEAGKAWRLLSKEERETYNNEWVKETEERKEKQAAARA